MTAPSNQPAGFCPYCGYRIDPGVCSECGRTVQNPASSKWRAYWNNISRPFVIICFLILFAVGSAFVWRYQIVRFAPARLLLPFVTRHQNFSSQELERRYFEDALSASDTIEFFDRGTELLLTVQKRIPVGSSILVRGTFKHVLPLGCDYLLGSWKATLDGNIIANSSAPYRSIQNSDTWIYELPPLKSGRYKIVVLQSATPATTGGLPGLPGGVVPSKQFSFRAHVELDIVDANESTAFDKIDCEQAFADAVSAMRVRVNYLRALRKWGLDIIASDPPFTFAGALVIRGANGEYQLVDRVVLFERGERTSLNWLIPEEKEVSIDDTVDVFLVPDAAVATELPVQHVLSAIVAWELIPLNKSDYNSGFQEQLNVKVAPGEVYRPSRLISKKDLRYSEIASKLPFWSNSSEGKAAE